MYKPQVILKTIRSGHDVFGSRLTIDRFGRDPRRISSMQLPSAQETDLDEVC